MTLRCPSCGCIDAPWSRGHAPHCGAYVDRRTVRRCDGCGLVLEVDVGLVASHTPWRCAPCAATRHTTHEEHR
jgi:hypothetical protein